MTLVEFSIITFFFVFGLTSLLLMMWLNRKERESVKLLIMFAVVLILLTTPAYFPLFCVGLIF